MMAPEAAAAAAASPPRERASADGLRPFSRFKEGSMNDRVSNVPPPQFLGPAELKDFESQFFPELRETDSSSDAGSEVASNVDSNAESELGSNVVSDQVGDSDDSNFGKNFGGNSSRKPRERPASASALLQSTAPGSPRRTQPHSQQQQPPPQQAPPQPSQPPQPPSSPKKATGFFGRVRDALSFGRSARTAAASKTQQQEMGKPTTYYQQPPSPPARKSSIGKPQLDQAQAQAHLSGAPAHAQPAAVALPALHSKNSFSDRPSRDEVMQSYNQLMATGFFQAHAIQSTRQPPPGAAGQRHPPPAATGQRHPPPGATGQRQPPPGATGQRQPPPAAAGQRHPPPGAAARGRHVASETPLPTIPSRGSLELPQKQAFSKPGVSTMPRPLPEPPRASVTSGRDSFGVPSIIRKWPSASAIPPVEDRPPPSFTTRVTTRSKSNAIVNPPPLPRALAAPTIPLRTSSERLRQSMERPSLPSGRLRLRPSSDRSRLSNESIRDALRNRKRGRAPESEDTSDAASLSSSLRFDGLKKRVSKRLKVHKLSASASAHSLRSLADGVVRKTAPTFTNSYGQQVPLEMPVRVRSPSPAAPSPNANNRGRPHGPIANSSNKLRKSPRRNPVLQSRPPVSIDRFMRSRRLADADMMDLDTAPAGLNSTADNNSNRSSFDTTSQQDDGQSDASDPLTIVPDANRGIPSVPHIPRHYKRGRGMWDENSGAATGMEVDWRFGEAAI